MIVPAALGLVAYEAGKLGPVRARVSDRPETNTSVIDRRERNVTDLHRSKTDLRISARITEPGSPVLPRSQAA